MYSTACECRQASSNNRYTHIKLGLLDLFHVPAERERERCSSFCISGSITPLTSSPRPRLQMAEAGEDTPKTLLAWKASAGYASKRESITRDEGCMPKPQSGQKVPQVSTAHRRSGGRSWAPEEKARSKKTCMKRRHRITMEGRPNAASTT